jgi:F-type H+-transporting ATPase subunit alpha
VEILKQDKLAPLPLEKQVMILFAGTRGYLDSIPLELIKPLEREFYTFMESKFPAVPEAIRKTTLLDDKSIGTLKEGLDEFLKLFKEKHKL